MNVVQACLDSPVSTAIGWTLLHSLWQGAAIAVSLVPCLLVTRSARARYAAASLALISIVIAFGFTFVTVIPSTSGSVQTAITDFSGLAPSNIGSGAVYRIAFAAIVPWLTLAWIAGVAIACIGQFAGWMSIQHLRWRGVCRASSDWQNQIGLLSARLRVSRVAVLLESSLAKVPMVLGHFRPMILVPIGLLSGMPPAQIEAILLHELAHIQRCDYLINIFQRAIEALLFYHPAVWWISRVIRTEREHCCDDLAVAALGNRHEYASALAALEQTRAEQEVIAITGGNLVKRIRRILYPPSVGDRKSSLAGAILIATALATFGAWQVAVAQQQTSSSDPYERWLKEEVVYIITNGERDAFIRLTTNEEKDKFIEQFWARRDPTPGTARNEFQEEHYRRIGYANARFAERAGLPGWKTDRGRMYIVFGPPDELESHPAGSAERLYPFEQWRYRYIESVGTNVILDFEDRARNGEFRMTTDPNH